MSLSFCAEVTPCCCLLWLLSQCSARAKRNKGTTLASCRLVKLLLVLVLEDEAQGRSVSFAVAQVFLGQSEWRSLPCAKGIHKVFMICLPRWRAFLVKLLLPVTLIPSTAWLDLLLAEFLVPPALADSAWGWEKGADDPCWVLHLSRRDLKMLPNRTRILLCNLKEKKKIK